MVGSGSGVSDGVRLIADVPWDLRSWGPEGSLVIIEVVDLVLPYVGSIIDWCLL